VLTFIVFWWALRDLNPRPSRCKRDALPTELSARYFGQPCSHSFARRQYTTLTDFVQLWENIRGGAKLYTEQTMKRFRNRSQAGKELAEKLTAYADKDGSILALPRGGIPVAFEIAKRLNLPLELLLVRKLGVPGHEELAFGAIASGGVRILNDDIVASLGISHPTIETVTARENAELGRREKLYQGDKPFPKLEGKTVIVVDDGIATGATMRVAVKALREHKPAKIVVAAPTSAPDTYEQLRLETHEVVCLATPEPYLAVGTWYDDFSQTTDEEVKTLLAQIKNSS
jgi:putative phosphoribosyl transferase